MAATLLKGPVPHNALPCHTLTWWVPKFRKTAEMATGIGSARIPKPTGQRHWPGRSAKLGDVFQRLFSMPLEGAHDARADVLACAQVFYALRGKALPLG